ncbi:UNVERIFIED_CONTAM: hypothetical protein NCL1_46709 [Trichonephila clavipes]
MVQRSREKQQDIYVTENILLKGCTMAASLIHSLQLRHLRPCIPMGIRVACVPTTYPSMQRGFTKVVDDKPHYLESQSNDEDDTQLFKLSYYACMRTLNLDIANLRYTWKLLNKIYPFLLNFIVEMFNNTICNVW